MNTSGQFLFNAINKYLKPVLFPNARHNATQPNHVKVTVIGAAGKIGQPLCLMLKQSPLIEELCVHDIVATSGFASELNHIDTNCKVTAFTGPDNMDKALKHSKIVVVLAAAPEADFLPFDKMWPPNAQIVQSIVQSFSKSCPRAFLAIGTNPINSMVPMACEILKRSGHFNPNAIFGITTLNTVRANTFVAHAQGLEPECVVVPVIGGHTEETIIPLLSKAKPCAEFTEEELDAVTMSIRKAQDNMHKLKHPDSAPFSGAFATARFVISLVKAYRGYPDVVETAFVPSKAHPQLKYLATPTILGPNGVAKNLGIPELTDFESCMLSNAMPYLINDAKRGEEYAGVVIEGQKSEGELDVKAMVPRCPEEWKKQNRL